MTPHRSIYKRLLGKLFEEEIGLFSNVEDPLVPDSVAGIICPNCGEMEASVRKVQDAEVHLSGENSGMGASPEDFLGPAAELIDMAVCAACGAEFPPPSPTGAEGVVMDVLGERERVLRRLDDVPLQEAMPLAHFISR